MSYYWDEKFIKHVRDDTIKTVFEVGARHGDESIVLSQKFPQAIIHSFECNPLTVDTCRAKLADHKNIIFNAHGLGNNNETLPFYSFIDNNDGASSLLKRIDYDSTQRNTGFVQIKKLSTYFEENNNIGSIDLLCMDIQGYELNVMKGAEQYLSKIKYVIMEEPKPVINTMYLPPNVHSKYVGSPTSQKIHEFMNKHGFIEIERIPENMIEDNVMYKNINFVHTTA